MQMYKKINHIEWKTVLIGSIFIFLIITVMGTIASALADIILYSAYKIPFHFTLFPKTEHGFVLYSLESTGYSETLDRYYKSISLTIGLVVTILGYFLGGFITAKKAKLSFVLNGTIAGLISAVLLLSWVTPLYVVAAYFGALLARRKKSRQTIQ
jgi:hypothetical protein